MTKKHIARHKVRFDRGGNYLNYLTVVFTGGTFLKVFGATWWVYIAGAFGVIAYRYIAGYVEEKIGIIQAEQSRYYDLNPAWKEMNDKIDTIVNNTMTQ